MADDIIDEMDEDFNEDMSDILDESFDDDDPGEDMLTELSHESAEEKKPSRVSRILDAAKGLPKKMLGSKKAIIITAGSIVFLILAVLALWFFVFRADPEPPVPDPQTAQGEIQPEAEKEVVFEDIVELEPFERLRLKASSTMGTVSLVISLELTDARYRKTIYSMEDRIRKIVEQQLRSATWLELRNPEGKILLKYNLIKRINAVFPKTTVRNVYFTEFIMQ